MNQKEVEKQMKNNQFPDELTFDQFDDISWDKSKQFGLYDNRENRLIAKDVLAYAIKHHGQIYTQVDGNTDRIYSKGLRFVNRTGMYEVVFKKGFEVDNS